MEYKFSTIHAVARTFAFAALAVAALPRCYAEPNVSAADITHTANPNGASIDANSIVAEGASGLTIQPSVDGGKCLQVQSAPASTASATSSVGVGACTGAVAQRWVYTNGQLLSAASKQCLDVAGTAPIDANATMTVATCDSNRVSQAWIVDRGILYVNNGNTQFSLALGTNPPTDGSAVHLGAVDFNDAAQKWAFNVTAQDTAGRSSAGFHITPASSPTACLDIDANNLVTNPCSDANSQQWIWQVTGLLQSAADANNCISLPANPNAGVQPNLVACDAAVVPELWISTGGEFVNNSMSKCVDATGSAAGAPVQVNDCNGAASQQWAFGAH